MLEVFGSLKSDMAAKGRMSKKKHKLRFRGRCQTEKHASSVSNASETGNSSTFCDSSSMEAVLVFEEHKHQILKNLPVLKTYCKLCCFHFDGSHNVSFCPNCGSNGGITKMDGQLETNPKSVWNSIPATIRKEIEDSCNQASIKDDNHSEQNIDGSSFQNENDDIDKFLEIFDEHLMSNIDVVNLRGKILYEHADELYSLLDKLFQYESNSMLLICCRVKDWVNRHQMIEAELAHTREQVWNMKHILERRLQSVRSDCNSNLKDWNLKQKVLVKIMHRITTLQQSLDMISVHSQDLDAMKSEMDEVARDDRVKNYFQQRNQIKRSYRSRRRNAIVSMF